MFQDLGAQLVLTGVFTVTGGYAVWRAATTKSTSIRTAMALHGAMAVAMIAMTWPWGAALPSIPQAVLFGAAAIGFVGLGLAESTRAVRGVSVEHPPVLQFFHAVNMAAMVWMLLAMPEAHHGTLGHALSAPGVVTGVVAVAALLGGSAVVLADAFGHRDRPPSRPVLADDLAAVMMALAMAAACAAMLAL